MCKIVSRLRQIANNEGITVAALERSLGASKGVLSRAIANGTDIQTKWIEVLVENYPQYSAHWLLTGEGSMLCDTNETMPVVLSQGNSIPLIPIDEMAGFLSGEMSIHESECERLIIPGLKADFVIQVCGDSMEPRYYSGDYVACQYIGFEAPYFQWGKVYVLDTAQGVIIKKIKRGSSISTLTCVSENPDYEPFEIPKESIYHIALVKGLIRIS